MKTLTLLVGALAVGVTACGSDEPTADPAAGTVVEIVMTDMAFTPATIDVSAGRTVTFKFRNDGTVRHEAVFGDLDEQLAHHEEMSGTADADHDMSGMGDGAAEHGDLDGVSVEPGNSIEVTRTFDQTGETMIGCHEPGHWEAGMKLGIEVV